MMKIRNVKQLNNEKRRLAHRKAELEKEFRYDWLDLKEAVNPGRFARQFFSKPFNESQEKNGKNFLAVGLSWLAAMYTKKLIVKAQQKIARVFRKK